MAVAHSYCYELLLSHSGISVCIGWDGGISVASIMKVVDGNDIIING